MGKSKLLTALKRFLFGLIIIFSFQLHAIENVQDSIKTFNREADWVPTSSLYIELGGKFIPTLNIDFRKRENFVICIGTGFWKDNEEHEQLIFTPSVNAYYIFGKKKRIELGGGTGPFLSTYEGFASLMVYGNIGYRYQKKKGLLFRAGFTPFVGIPVNDKSRFLATPWAGISLGYSF